MSAKSINEDNVASMKRPAREATEDLHEAAHQAGCKVRGMVDKASGEFSHVSDHVTQEIHANPVRSSVIALGIGVLLGALIRR